MYRNRHTYLLFCANNNRLNEIWKSGVEEVMMDKILRYFSSHIKDSSQFESCNDEWEKCQQHKSRLLLSQFSHPFRSFVLLANEYFDFLGVFFLSFEITYYKLAFSPIIFNKSFHILPIQMGKVSEIIWANSSNWCCTSNVLCIYMVILG